jgi:glycosyltransferase involved in cell wall biosynthesis
MHGHVVDSELSIVIPAYNEEAGIGPTLDDLLRAFPTAEIIVVDDCSTDRTAEIVCAYSGIKLVRHKFNRGQGGAIKSGMLVATRAFVAWFDADHEHRTSDLLRLYERIQSEKLAAIIGQRVTPSADFLRGGGKWLIRLIGRGLRINVGSDLNCGLRVFRRDVVMRYRTFIPDRFSASLITTLILVEQRYPIAFEPVSTNPRIGQSTVKLHDGFTAVISLLRAIMLFAPVRIFMPFGLFMVAAGGLYSTILVFVTGRGLPVGGALLMIAGLLSIMLGLIADQISQLRLSQLPEASFVLPDELPGDSQ